MVIESTRCLRVIVAGRVQGVCFRHYTRKEANRLGITGWVRNLPGGSVEALVCGSETQLANMQAWLAHGPDSAQISRCSATPASEPCPPDTFRIIY